MEVEAVTHALRWLAPRVDSRTTYAIIFTDPMSLLQKVTRDSLDFSIQRFSFGHPPSKAPVDVLFWTCRSQGR